MTRVNVDVATLRAGRFHEKTELLDAETWKLVTSGTLDTTSMPTLTALVHWWQSLGGLQRTAVRYHVKEHGAALWALLDVLDNVADALPLKGA